MWMSDKKRIIDKIFIKISGNIDDFSFEHRLFNATLFLTMVVGVISTFTNVILHLYNSAISTALISVISYFLYLKSKKSEHVILLVKFYILITSVWIIYLWFFNAGSFGPVGYTFFMIVFVYNVIYTGNHRAFINIWIILLMLGLFFTEYWFPEFVEQYKNPEKERFKDMVISVFTLLFIYSYIVSFLIKTFNEERKKVISQRDLIIEQNEEITLTQEELYEHKENLEKIVRQRTIALEKAKEKAERSDRLKTAFLSNMSHEIRTPMNVILGLSKILKEKKMDESKRNEYLEIITQKGNLLLNIINDIIDIAKIESNELKINKESCSISEILQDVYITYSNIINKENPDIRFILNISPNLENRYMLTDPLRLKQVLFNLVENARKFTKKGYIKIGAEERQNKIILYVEDTGIGIPKDKHKEVFNRFRQVEDVDTKTHEGTGLGLTISKKITELLSGNMYLESEPGKGSVFYVELPLVEINIDKSDTSRVVNEQVGGVNWIDKKILIAEDEEFNFIILQDILEETNINIVHAKNGEETLRLLDDTFDLILLDIQMPVKSGFEICPVIRKQFPEIPVIAQTAYVLNQEKQELLDLGCNEIITKPVDLDDFLRVLSKYIS